MPSSIDTKSFLIFLFTILLLPAVVLAAPEYRTALIIGNSNYESGRLNNPVNDASDMAATLKALGFEVILRKNIDLQGMEESLEELGNRLKRGGVGLFYFAGHGVQVGGTNYLIPTGARIRKESDVKYQAMDLGKVLDELANANNSLNIVILDACRDNPFARSFRSATRGLAIVSSAPGGTFISYATGPGQVAQDGTGRNSPFTSSLLEFIKTPGIPIEQVFKKVRQKLVAAGQTPWELSSIQGDFYFYPSSKSSPVEIIKVPAPEQNPFLQQAQAAYDAGFFAEPEGNNAIELARRALHDNPDDFAAKELITQAAAAYENQAKLALARQDGDKSGKIYQRLLKLFPDQKTYLQEIIALEKSARPSITGTWHWAVRSPFVPDRTNTINADGTCTLNGMGGTWSYQEGNKNKIFFHWDDTWTHKMTLSKDGQAMIGTDDWGTKVTGRKISEGQGVQRE
jgi:hypothetical protein